MTILPLSLRFQLRLSTYSGGTVVDETGCPIGGNGGPHSGDYAGVMVPSTAVLGTGGLTLLPGAQDSPRQCEQPGQRRPDRHDQQQRGQCRTGPGL